MGNLEEDLKDQEIREGITRETSLDSQTSKVTHKDLKRDSLEPKIIAISNLETKPSTK